MAPTPKRGEIWLVNFGPTVGAKIRKVRPAVVKSLSENRFVKRLGEVTAQQLNDIAAAVALCVGAP